MLCANISNIIQTAQARPSPGYVIFSFLFLVVRMLLVVRPGAPSGVLAPSSDALAPEVLDYFVADLNHGKSCAVMFYPNVEAFCHTSSTDVTPFGTDKIVLSLGMGIVALLSIPLGYYNLEDNVVVQNVAMVVILLSTFAWFSIFASLGLDRERVPLIGSSLHNMGGTILFNFMCSGCMLRAGRGS